MTKGGAYWPCRREGHHAAKTQTAPWRGTSRLAMFVGEGLEDCAPPGRSGMIADRNDLRRDTISCWLREPEGRKEGGREKWWSVRMQAVYMANAVGSGR